MKVNNNYESKNQGYYKKSFRDISILMHKIIFGQKNTKLTKINRTNVMKVHILNTINNCFF